MAFALSAYEAALLAEELGQVVAFGAQESIAASQTWIPYVGAAVAGSLPVAAFAYSQMAGGGGRSRARSRSARSQSRAPRRRRLNSAPPRRGIQSKNLRIGGILGREVKWTDRQASSTAVPQSWNIIGPELTGVAQGTARYQRIGRVASPMKLLIQGTVTFGSEPIRDWCKLAIVWDKQVNGTTLNPADVYTNFLDGPGLNVVDADNRYNVQRDLEWTQRFTVLRDMTITNHIGGFGGTLDQSLASPIPFSFYINLPEKYVTNYSDTGSSISDIVDNSLHMIAVCNNTGVTMRFVSRMKYIG